MSHAQVLPPVDDVDPGSNRDVAYEETDEFVTASNGGETRPLFDLSMLASAPNATSQGRASASVATTAELASSVGSVMMMPKEAFMKSFTFHKPAEGEPEIKWGITFGEQIKTKSMLMSKSRLPVATIDEDSIFSLSRIRPGDYLKTINGKTVGPSYNGARALAKMKSCLQNDGYLTVLTKNKEEGADDILVHCTIVKPDPNMTMKDLGMTVWIWGYLCIKSLRRGSIFRETALKETDNIVSINEILCERVNAEQFADIVKALPKEITITVLRRRQRRTGDFK